MFVIDGKDALAFILSNKAGQLFIVDGNSNIKTQEILRKYSNHPNINIIWLKKPIEEKRNKIKKNFIHGVFT